MSIVKQTYRLDRLTVLRQREACESIPLSLRVKQMNSGCQPFPSSKETPLTAKPDPGAGDAQ